MQESTHKSGLALQTIWTTSLSTLLVNRPDDKEGAFQATTYLRKVLRTD